MSGLYRRPRNCTGSAHLSARGLSPPIGNWEPCSRTLPRRKSSWLY